MLLQLLTIARNAFIESVRQPVLILLVLLSGVFQLFSTWNTGFAMSTAETGKLVGDNKLLFDIGLSTIFVMGVLLAGFIATAVMSREIENKTVLTVVSKPVQRYTLVLGKYLGVAAALIGAIVVMLIFLLLGVRHGVMSTTADDLDGPVLVFGLLGVFIPVALGAWCNYFYGWNFAQTAMSLLVPFMVAAYVGVLFFAKHWKVQSPLVDLNDQVFMASVTLGLAILVLSAVATAASTRLGQVMTIVVCCGAFIMSLLSNHLIGKYVFTNTPFGVVGAVALADTEKAFNTPGQTLTIALTQPTNAPPPTLSTLYYSPSPSGFPMLNENVQPFTGDLQNINTIVGRDATDSMVVAQSERQVVKVRVAGRAPLSIAREPIPGDYLFTRPTHTNIPALVAWVSIPNLQLFWLLDAVTQNRTIPLPYVIMCAIYAGLLIVAFLSLGVMLFQRRDVG